jgi:hypothetical protein
MALFVKKFTFLLKKRDFSTKFPRRPEKVYILIYVRHMVDGRCLRGMLCGRLME